MRGAIAARANEVFGRGLTNAERRAAKRLLIRMVHSGAGAGYARQRTTMPDADPVAVATIRKLADARLVVTERDAATGRETVEVAHEALIRGWQRLRGWVDQDREFLRTRERIAAQARLWKTEARPADRLLPPGRPLAEGEDLIEKRRADLDEDLVEYVLASTAAEASRKKAARVSQRRQLVRARLTSVAMLVLALAAAGLAYWAESAREAALLNAHNLDNAFKRLVIVRRNQSRALAVLANIEAQEGSPATAIRVALAALSGSLEGPGPPYASDAEGALLRSLGQLQEMRRFVGHGDALFSTAFSPDGRTVATGSRDKTARVWEVATGKEIATLRGHEGYVWSVAFSPDGRTLATGSSDNTARLWEVASGKEIATLRGHDGSVQCVAFSSDGRTLATGSWDRSARLWELATGKQIATLRGHENNVTSVVFSPDGRTLVTGSDDKTARLWEVATGEQMATLRGHEGFVTSVVFSSDGGTLATGSGDKTARLWKVATGKQIATLRGHEDFVTSVVFSSDGGMLATGSGDKTARLWEVATGKQIATLRHENYVNSIAFSLDGRMLTTGSLGQKVRFWPVGQRLIDLACARVHDLPLSEQDKQRFGIENEWCTPEVSEQLRAKLGLDKPVESVTGTTAP